MIYTSDWAYYDQQAVKNGFAELTQEDLQRYAPHIWDMTPAQAWEQAKVNSKVYMIPQNIESFSHVGAVIRGDLREKYGLPPISSVSAFNDFLYKVAEQETTILPYNGGKLRRMDASGGIHTAKWFVFRTGWLLCAVGRCHGHTDSGRRYP